MATTEQLKALIKAHCDDDNERFKTVALQIAAHEAKVGHTSSARDIKNVIQNSKSLRKKQFVFEKKLETLEKRESSYFLSDIILNETLEFKLRRIIDEFHNKGALRASGLKNRSKILLIGKPGTGKTMTASVIANEINLPLYVIQIDKLVTKYMGETSVKLRQVFDHIEEFPGVYLFDEFDAIGSDRNMDNDVGEMRRILNSFLQYLENADTYSMIIAATNNPDLLDRALFRRFDDVLEYCLPEEDEIIRIMKNKLNGFADSGVYEIDVIETAMGLSQYDITKACEEALKYKIMNEIIIDKQLIIRMLHDRRDMYRYKEA